MPRCDGGQLCLEAIPTSVALSARSCQFEGLFSDLSTPSKEPFALMLFHCVKELLSQSREKFISGANLAKTPLALLPFKKHPLTSSSNPVAVPNASLSLIIGSFPTSRLVSVEFAELTHMESVTRQTIHTQSFTLDF